MNSRHWPLTIRAECGYTVIESVVALALLITVLVPASATLSYFIAQKRNQSDIHALAAGRRVMEETLYRQEFTNAEFGAGKDWLVRREIMRDGGLITISVSVYSGVKSIPRVELSTIRIER